MNCKINTFISNQAFMSVVVALVALLVGVQCDIRYIQSFGEVKYLNSLQSASSFDIVDSVNGSLIEFINKYVTPELAKLQSTNDKIVSLARSKKNNNVPKFWKGSPETYLIDKQASVSIKTTQILKKLAYEKELPDDILKNLRIPSPYCYFVDKICCDPYSAYRSLNGSCNNLQNPTWGMSNAPYRRLKPAEYAGDSLNDAKIKSAATGRKLPNARLIATTLHDQKPPVSDYSMLLIFFAQLVDHDVLTTASSTYEDGTPVVCECGSNDSNCVNIPIPKSENIFPPSTQCIPMVRSSASNPDYYCNLGYREQLNMQSSWTDLSNLYPTELETLQAMRGKYGKLKVSYSGFSVNLPYNDDKTKCDPSKQDECYRIGDLRAQTNTILMSVYNLFLRQHNWLAIELFKLNQQWSDDKIFEEARKINTAIYQHILYNELLRLLLGRRVYETFKLEPKQHGYSYAYESDKYPNTLNEFTFAFRLHSMVNTNMGQADSSLKSQGTTSIGEYVFNLTKYVHGADGILYGSLINPTYFSSPFVSPWLNHQLFDKFQMKASLPAITNQRTRDHGIPAYYKYREMCGLGIVKTWDDLHTTTPRKSVQLLKKLYDSPLSVELYAGGSSERAVDDAILPPTFSCIIAKQFHDLKYYDRFYYELGNDVHTRFGEDQLEQIRHASMAWMLCKFSGLKRVQQNPFLLPHKRFNPLVECHRVLGVSVKPWKVDLEAYKRLVNNSPEL